jgi:CDP-diacylglycerol--serine O-phosphatidyltransferase
MRPGAIPPPDGSRDRRIDDPTNIWFVHLIGRMLLPAALRLGVPANAVSVAGLALGSGAAWAYARWPDWRWASAGFALCVAWLIADGLDGMIARASGTTSDFGRFLDGLCDHAIFVLLYVVLASSLGTAEAWILALSAGAAHAVQSTLYEGERERFHRRIRGEPGRDPRPRARNPLVRAYDRVAGSLDRVAAPMDALLARSGDARAVGEAYGRRAAPVLRPMALLTNNMRVILIYLACLAGDPRLFWWAELVPLSLLAAAGIAAHRGVERRILRESA